MTYKVICSNCGYRYCSIVYNSCPECEHKGKEKAKENFEQKREPNKTFGKFGRKFD